jgi:hypothetical protein
MIFHERFADIEKSHESHSLGFNGKEFPGWRWWVDQNRSFPIETDLNRSILAFFSHKGRGGRRKRAGFFDGFTLNFTVCLPFLYRF